mgnify:CR=1 FL=1
MSIAAQSIGYEAALKHHYQSVRARLTPPPPRKRIVIPPPPPRYLTDESVHQRGEGRVARHRLLVVEPVVEHPAHDHRRRAERIDALLGQYSFDTSTPIGPGTWGSTYWSAQTALSALTSAGLAGRYSTQAIGLAATWNTDLLEQVGTATSTEARAKFNMAGGPGSDHKRYEGLTIWSPNINIFRDPRWGRGMETYGEDPFLTGQLAVGFIRGLHGSADTFDWSESAEVQLDPATFRDEAEPGEHLEVSPVAESPTSWERWQQLVTAHAASTVRARAYACPDLRLKFAPPVMSDGLTAAQQKAVIEKVIGTVPEGTRADAQRAIEAANRAAPGWASLSAFDRAADRWATADRCASRRPTGGLLSSTSRSRNHRSRT